LLGALAVFFLMLLGLSIRMRLERRVRELEEEVERLGGQAAR